MGRMGICWNGLGKLSTTEREDAVTWMGNMIVDISATQGKKRRKSRERERNERQYRELDIIHTEGWIAGSACRHAKDPGWALKGAVCEDG